jgi:hypothetical protein
VIPIKQTNKQTKKNNEEGQDQPVFAQAIKYSNAIFRPKLQLNFNYTHKKNRRKNSLALKKEKMTVKLRQGRVDIQIIQFDTFKKKYLQNLRK